MESETDVIAERAAYTTDRTNPRCSAHRSIPVNNSRTPKMAFGKITKDLCKVKTCAVATLDRLTLNVAGSSSRNKTVREI